MTTAILRILTSVTALSVAAACTVTTTDDNEGKGDGGGSNSGGSSSGDSGTGGATGSGGSSTAGGSDGAGGNDDAGAGGSDDAGAGGQSGGDGGPDGATSPAQDPCDRAEATPNEDRDHSTAYGVGTRFEGCLQHLNDIDFYELTVPATPVQGGVVVVKFTDVGAEGAVDLTVYSGADNGEIQNHYGTRGQSTFSWFNAVPGGTYRVRVEPWGALLAETPYTMQIDFTGVPDTHEPNDLRADAKAITVGTPVEGYFFAGYLSSTSILDAAWEDWFEVTLPAGDVQVALTDLASDVAGDITLYDSLGVQLASEYQTTRGGSVILVDTVTQGAHFIKIQPWSSTPTRGEGSTPASYTSQPYTLTVTTP